MNSNVNRSKLAEIHRIAVWLAINQGKYCLALIQAVDSGTAAY